MDSGLFSGRLLGSGPAGGRPRSGVGDVTSRLGAVGADRVAQHVAAAPHGLDVVVAAGRGGQLLAELADEDVDDLQLRRSEEHTSELQSLMRISYAVFCLQKKNNYNLEHTYLI